MCRQVFNNGGLIIRGHSDVEVGKPVILNRCNLLITSETRRDSQRHAGTRRDTQRHTETRRDTQRHAETRWDTQRHAETR